MLWNFRNYVLYMYIVVVIVVVIVVSFLSWFCKQSTCISLNQAVEIVSRTCPTRYKTTQGKWIFKDMGMFLLNCFKHNCFIFKY